jgi:DnaK suppressor protein
MTKAEIDKYRRLLLTLKKRIAGDLSDLEEEALRPSGGEAAGNLSDVPIHPADLGTENFDEEIAVTLVDNEGRIVSEINDALARIEQGTFGKCENCHQEISRDRLRVLPYARYCIRCARQLGVGANH